MTTTGPAQQGIGIVGHVVDQGNVADRLRRIEAVTDSALAHLSTEQMLNELLTRVREALRADTATVLLLDPTGHQLTAVAAVGIEEEVRQGVRVPLGRGFAGTIAATHRPMIVDHVDPTSVVNPLLWERGLRVLLGVPLVAAGRLIGVLHIGALTGQRFTEHDISLLQMVADRIALAVHTQVSAEDRAASAALQRSLLPAVLPALPGCEFAARYVPGESDVGGDWYDVFPLPGDRIGIVMGDVVGHGLAAAVVMGRLRSALRAYALDEPDPAHVLAKLDRKARHFEVGVMATVSYAVVSPDRAQVTVSLAGHLPPVRVEPGGAGELMTLPVAPPIGFPHEGPYPSGKLDLPTGAVLCFFTDGLVERRDSTIDDGLARLCAAVTAEEPEAVCSRVMAELVGMEKARDDIALLAVRRFG